MALPVFQTVRRAYGALWRQKALLSRFAVVPAVLSFIAVFASERGLAAFPQRTEIESLGTLASELALVPFVVQAYRLFLLGPEDRSCGSWYWLGSGYRGVLALTVVFWFLLEAPAYAVGEDVYEDVFRLMVGEARPERFAAVSAFLACFGLYLFISIRLAFLYPSLSLADRLDLAARWRETSGCFWRLFMACILSTVPLLVVLFSTWAVALAAVTEAMFDDDALESASGLEAMSLVDSVGLSVATALFSVIFYGAIAAVIALAYARLTGFPAKGLEAGGAEQL